MARGAQNKEVKNLGRVTPFIKSAIPSLFFFLGTMRDSGIIFLIFCIFRKLGNKEELFRKNEKLNE